MRVMGRETTAQKRDIELLAAVYRRGVRRFVERVSALDERHWRARDGDGFHRALAHLAVAQETGLQLIRESLAGRVDLPPAMNVQAENSEADFVQESATGLLAHVERLVDEQLSIILGLADDGLLETPGVVPEWRHPGSLGRLYDHLYVHLVFHYQEMRAATPALAHWFEDWMPETSNDFYDRLFRLLPVVYNPEALGEVESAAICIDLMQPGGGRWSLWLEPGRARSTADCEGPMNSTIRAKPRDFFDFFRGEGGRVKITGNVSLARSLRALFPLS